MLCENPKTFKSAAAALLNVFLGFITAQSAVLRV
jgi:hypothetical protein